MNNIRFIIQVCKGLIRHSRMRRTMMFYIVLALLLLLFAGATFFWGWLREHPAFFLGYWGFCTWLTFLVAMLALYDMIRISVDARQERRQLKKDILGQSPDDSSHDSHAR